MKHLKMGLHEKEERNRAYRLAKAAYEEGMKVPVGSPMRAYNAGYLQAIIDLARDQGQEELVNLVFEFWVALQ